MANDILMSLLSPEQRSQAQEDAFRQGLLGLSQGLIRAAIPQGGRRTSTLEALAMAAPGAVQSYRGSFDQTLKDLLTNMQVKDMMAKREREANLQKAIQGAITPSLTMPDYQRAQSNIDPMALEGMSATSVAQQATPTGPATIDRNAALAALAQYGGIEGLGTYLTATKPVEAPETFRPLSASEIKERGLPPGNYQISSKSGKVSPIGGEKVAINLADPTAVGKEIRAIAADFTKELRDRGLTEVADRYRALDTSVRSALGGNRLAQGAIIYNVAKIYDPSGAVQEGDKATVLGNRSIPDSVRAIAQRVFEGGDLAPAEISALYSNVTKIVQDKAALVDPIKRNYAADIEALSPGRSSRLVSPFEGIRFGEAIGTTVRERQK